MLRRVEAVGILLASFGIAVLVVSHRPWVEQVLVNLAVDVSYTLLDPRIRLR